MIENNPESRTKQRQSNRTIHRWTMIRSQLLAIPLLIKQIPVIHPTYLNRRRSIEASEWSVLDAARNRALDVCVCSSRMVTRLHPAGSNDHRYRTMMRSKMIHSRAQLSLHINRTVESSLSLSSLSRIDVDPSKNGVKRRIIMYHNQLATPWIPHSTTTTISAAFPRHPNTIQYVHHLAIVCRILNPPWRQWPKRRVLFLLRWNRFFQHYQFPRRKFRLLLVSHLIHPVLRWGRYWNDRRNLRPWSFWINPSTWSWTMFPSVSTSIRSLRRSPRSQWTRRRTKNRLEQILRRRHRQKRHSWMKC